jgi:hypothetical protein
MAMAAADGGNPWGRLPDESGVWYDRFVHYLSAGPGRSIDGAWRRHRETSTKPAPNQHQRANGIWKATASKYRWAERAAAWDVHQGKLMVEAAERDAIEAHRRHVLMTRKHFNQVSIAGEKIQYSEITDPLRWVAMFERVLDMERRAHLAPVHARALAKAERAAEKIANEAVREGASQAATEADAQWDVTPETIVEVARLWAELGISIHDDPPAAAQLAAGPLALPGPPTTPSAGS